MPDIIILLTRSRSPAGDSERLDLSSNVSFDVEPEVD